MYLTIYYLDQKAKIKGGGGQVPVSYSFTFPMVAICIYNFFFYFSRAEEISVYHRKDLSDGISRTNITKKLFGPYTAALASQAYYLNAVSMIL